MIKNKRKQSDMTATPNKYPQKEFKDKGCKYCSELFSPMAPSHMYCSDHCKDQAKSNHYYINVYGISLEKFRLLLKQQDYKCAICKSVGFKMHAGIKENLVVDHCHSTGNVRGLLCNNCNRGLGLFKDNKKSLLQAINYLEGATTIPKGSTLKQVEAHSTDE